MYFVHLVELYSVSDSSIWETLFNLIRLVNLYFKRKQTMSYRLTFLVRQTAGGFDLQPRQRKKIITAPHFPLFCLPYPDA